MKQHHIPPPTRTPAEVESLIRYVLAMEKLLLELVQTRYRREGVHDAVAKRNSHQEIAVLLGARPTFLPDDGALPGTPGPLVCLKFAVHRNDDLPGFGAFVRPCHPTESQILPMSIVLNVGALFCPTLTDESGGPVSVTPAERVRNFIGTVMHEVGHALESHFDQDIGEDHLTAITEAWERQWNTVGNGPLEPIADEIVEEVRRRRLAGEKVELIAQRYGVTPSWVCKVTRTLGLRRSNSMTQDEIARALAMRQEGKTYREIGAILGRNFRTLRRSIKGLEITTP
jgi:hypothetical protein